MLHANLVTFAARYAVPVADAYVLPALFERTSELCNMAPSQLVLQALDNVPLGKYLAKCAGEVAAADRA